MQFIMNHFMSVIFILNFFLCLTIVFLRRKETAQTWAWLLVLTFIPIIGIVLYFFVGRGISQEKVFDVKSQSRIGLSKELIEQQEKFQSGIYPVSHMKRLDVDQLIFLLGMHNNSMYTADNQVKLFTDGTEKFQSLLKDIDKAKHHIHLQYYIYRSDHLGTKVRDALVKAAKRGVEVKVLIDGWGSSQIKRKFFQPLQEAGGEAIQFFPIFVPYLNPRLNYRNHRKIVVIDGEIAYTGGFNVGDEYLGKVKKFGYWRDNHLRIKGEAVYSLQNRFLMDWHSQRKSKVQYHKEYFPDILSKGEVDIQIATSGPDSDLEQIKMMYLKMINLAKKEILIQTPYYIPDDSIHEALKLALLSGVKVRIQIPNKPDHMLVYWATYSFVAELLEFGGDIETYENGFMHAKTMIIDGEIASVGSANIDIRSFRLDFEVNTLLYDYELANELREGFLRDSKDSKLLTKELYAKRSTMIRIKEGLARLISPLL